MRVATVIGVFVVSWGGFRGEGGLGVFIPVSRARESDLP